MTRPRARERQSASRDGGEAGDGEPPSAESRQTIRCTPGHPFFVEGRGWVLAGELRAGDELEARGERVVVAAVEVGAERAATFNFEVACHHTYFVAARVNQPAVLVHNTSRAQAIRAALSDSKGRLLSRAERRGIKHTIRRVESEGYSVTGAIKYGGNHGIDLEFAGVGQNVGRFAVAEAKHSRSLGSLARDTKGMRQMSRDWVVDRLGKAGRGDLDAAFGAGNLDLYVGLFRSKKLFKLDPTIYTRDINFRKNPLAAILIP